MVVFYLRSSKNPDSKVVPVTVSLSLDNLKPQNAPVREDQDLMGSGIEYPNLADLEADGSWILIAATTEPDINGNDIPPEFINVVTTGTVHLEIEAALGRIGKKIDWGEIRPDTKAPQLVEITPSLNQTTDVSIFSNVIFRLQEPIPAAGIDLSTLKVTINGFDVTPNVELRGNIFDLTAIYRPTRIT